jgi:hypothetical protein
LISEGDLQLVSVTDDPAQAAATVIACYERACEHDIAEVAGE